MKKNIICISLIIVITISSMLGSSASTLNTIFKDIPSGNWAEGYITKAVDLGVMSGYGNGVFGFGDEVTRSQYVAMLVRLFGWEKVMPDTPTFTDNSDKSKWYYSEIETAVTHGALIKDSTRFRPEENITREEMAIILIRALGYDTLSSDISYKSMPFSDVYKNKGFIKLAYDFGIIKGTTATTFEPSGYAKREQVAAMTMRLYDKYYSKLQWIHGFYAISSYSQSNYIPKLDALSFGWSKLQYTESGGPYLNTTSSNSNEFSIPSGYSEVVQLAKTNSVSANFNVYMSTDQKVELLNGTTSNACKEILLNASMRTQAISQIVELMRQGSYAGVTIDFEGMKGTELKIGLSEFLKELRKEIDKLGLKIYVCVPPATSDGYYYDAYDFKTIGNYADKVILMAHDYQATSLSSALMEAGFTTTPLTPIYDVYYAFEAITDNETGVEDKSKIALAVSFGSVQWSLKNGQVINSRALRPGTVNIYNRLLNPATTINYSKKYQNPYITFTNESDGTNNIVWYEDERSISAKVELARMFGINGISLWRLGLVPNYTDTTDRQIYYNVMEYILNR